MYDQPRRAVRARGDRRRMLELFYPEVSRRLLCLEATVHITSAREDSSDEQYTRWDHNEFKDRERAALDDDNQMLLYATCEQRQQCGSATEGGEN